MPVSKHQFSVGSDIEITTPCFPTFFLYFSLDRIEEAGAEHVAHEGLFHRGESQKTADEGPHELMRHVVRVGEDLVLQRSPFKKTYFPLPLYQKSR